MLIKKAWIYLQKPSSIVGLACAAFSISLIASLITNDWRVHLYNSDLLYLPTLYEDLNSWGGSISEWKLPPAPYFFPDMVLFFPLRAALGNYHLALILAGVIQTVLYTLGWLLLAAMLFSSAESRVCVQGFLLLIASAIMLPNGSGLRITIHFGIILLTPYILVLLIAYLRGAKPAAFYLSANFVLSALMAMSDSLYTFQVVVPLALTVALLFWIARVGFKQALLSQAPLIIGVLGGAWLNKVLIRYPNLEGYTRVDPTRAQKSIAEFLRWLPEWILENPLAATLILAALGWHLFIAIYSVRRAAMGRAFRTELSLISSFTAFSILIDIAAILATGNFIDRHSSRYLLPLFLFPLYAIPLWVGDLPFAKSTAAKAVLILASLWVISPRLPLLADLSSLSKYADFYPPFAECMDREACQRGLKNGIGHYWDAKYLTMLSKCDLKILQVTNSLTPYHWISNIAWYERFPAEFIIYDPKAPGDLYQMSKSAILAQFGEPADSFICAGREVLVYNRPSDSSLRESLIGQSLALRNQPLDRDFAKPGAEAVFYAASLPSRIGRVVGQSRTADAGEIGHLIYGPYIKLPAGSYEARIFYEAEQKSMAVPYIDEWDVAVASSDRIEVIAKGKLELGQDSVRVEFSLWSPSVVEIRVFAYGTGKLTVHKVELKRLR